MNRSVVLKVRRTTPYQRTMLRKSVGCCRKAWNLGLSRDLARMDAGEGRLSYTAQCKELTADRNSDELGYLSEVSCTGEQQALRDLDKAWGAFFDKDNPAGRPKFKKKGQGRDSMRVKGSECTVRADSKRIHIPNVGNLPVFNFERFLEMAFKGGVPKWVTVYEEDGSWWLSVCFEFPDEEIEPNGLPAVGVDVGVARPFALSDGTFIDMEEAQAKRLERMDGRVKRLQRKASRQQAGSKRKRRTNAEKRRLQRRAARSRRDFRHKATTAIAKNHGTVVVEDLKVEEMTESAKGTADNPGKDVKKKAALNRDMLDQGWAEARRFLAYKCADAGGELVAVNPAYTSQTCSVCGHRSEENRKTQAAFKCTACGHTENADTNAAKNILSAARRAVAARGGHREAGPAKREPRAA